MKTILHLADSRGHENHDWLDTHYTFSFSNYNNPKRMHFGTLRVLNDEVIAPGKGFGMHSHQNMEIVSIPLEGELEHKDNMGNLSIVKSGDIQVMSAGAGLVHSERNNSKDEPLSLLQIWLFPTKKQVSPRHDHQVIENHKINTFNPILTPYKDDSKVWICQNAWFYWSEFDEGISQTYRTNLPENGLYIFVVEGSVKVENQVLDRRDGYGIWDFEKINITATKNSKILLMDVPMTL